MPFTVIDVRCYMNLWGVAVLELDSHPDYNKGPDHAFAFILRPITLIDPSYTT